MRAVSALDRQAQRRDQLIVLPDAKRTVAIVGAKPTALRHRRHTAPQKIGNGTPMSVDRHSRRSRDGRLSTLGRGVGGVR